MVVQVPSVYEVWWYFFRNHQCNWLGNNNRVSAKCLVAACNDGAVVCRRQDKMNMPRELVNWLRSMKINPIISYTLVVGSHNIDGLFSKFKNIKTTSIPIPKITRETREKLQKGATERYMTDEEI